MMDEECWGWWAGWWTEENYQLQKVDEDAFLSTRGGATHVLLQALEPLSRKSSPTNILLHADPICGELICMRQPATLFALIRSRSCTVLILIRRIKANLKQTSA